MTPVSLHNEVVFVCVCGESTEPGVRKPGSSFNLGVLYHLSILVNVSETPFL